MIFYLEDFNGIKRESLQRKEKMKNLIETLDRSIIDPTDLIGTAWLNSFEESKSRKKFSLSWKTPASKFYILFQERKKKEKKEGKRNFGKRSKHR